MRFCIKDLPQAQNKYLFPQSQNKLNAIFSGETGRKKKAKNKTQIWARF